MKMCSLQHFHIARARRHRLIIRDVIFINYKLIKTIDDLISHYFIHQIYIIKSYFFFWLRFSHAFVKIFH